MIDAGTTVTQLVHDWQRLLERQHELAMVYIDAVRGGQSTNGLLDELELLLGTVAQDIESLRRLLALVVPDLGS
jgi:metal-dependent amidase/aminoacylase/carboxypeptidase family protein